MIVPVPDPAVLVVDRHPVVAAGRMIAARRDHGHARHDPLRDAPVVFAGLGVAARADQEAAGALDHLEMRLHVAERVVVALGADVKRIVLELAAVQPGAVAGIDAAFERLQPVALLQALGDVALLERHRAPFELGQRRLLVRRTHIGPQHVAALDQRIGLELDLRAEAGLHRLRRHLDALAVDAVLPAVIGAAQSVVLIASDPERRAAMGAELVHQRIVALAVAPGDQPLGQKLHPHRRASVLGQLARQHRRQPVAAEQGAHRRAGSGLGEEIVLFFAEHRLRSLSFRFALSFAADAAMILCRPGSSNRTVREC